MGALLPDLRGLGDVSEAAFASGSLELHLAPDAMMVTVFLVIGV